MQTIARCPVVFCPDAPIRSLADQNRTSFSLLDRLFYFIIIHRLLSMQRSLLSMMGLPVTIVFDLVRFKGLEAFLGDFAWEVKLKVGLYII